MTPIRAVLFDLDHTLFDHESAARAGLASLSGAFGVNVTDEIDELWFRIEDEQYERYMSGELDLLGQRRTRFRLFAAAIEREGADASDAEADAGWNAYYDGYVAAWRAFEESVPTLIRIRERGLKTGIITNGHHEQQVLKTERSGIRPHVDDVVSSGESGIAKPDPRIFHLACERLDVAPAETLFVGDNYAVDVEGALGAGLHALHIDRTATPAPAPAPAPAPTATPIPAGPGTPGRITRIDQVLTWLDTRTV